MLKKEFLKIFLVSLPMVFGPAVNLLFLTVVAKSVNVATYGELSYALALTSILIIFSDLGLRDYFLSKDGLSEIYSNSKNLLTFTLLIFLLLSAIIFSFLLPEKKILLLYSALLFEAIGLGVLLKVIYYHHQSINNLSNFSKYDTLFKSAPTAAKIITLQTTNDLTLSLLVGSLITTAIYGVWLKKSMIITEINFNKIYHELLALCLNWKKWIIYTISFGSFFLYFGADRLVVKHVLGTAQLALYSAAMSFMSVGQITVGVLWSLYMPRLSRGEFLWPYRTLIILSSALGIILVCFYFIFSKYIFNKIYPIGYSEGAKVLTLASLYFIFRLPNVVIEIHSIINHNYAKFVVARVIFGIFSIILSFSLLTVLGITGSAISLVTSEMLLMISFVASRPRNIQKKK